MKLEEIDVQKVCFYLSASKLPIEGTKFEAVERLLKFYGEESRRGLPMARCDVCECQSPAVLTECPFCGDASEVIQPTCDETEPRNELETACEIVRNCMKVASQNLYYVGKALIKIVDDRLWEQRIGEDGTKKYSGPYDCIKAECGMKRQSATRLIKVTRAYDEKTFAEHGISRLAVSMKLPEKKRRRFLKKVQMTETVKGSREEAQVAREILAEKPEEEAASKRKKLPKLPTTASVRLKLGSVTLPMFVRPTTRQKELVTATSIREYPWCDVHVGGDTFLGIRLTKTIDGEICAVLDVRQVKKKSGDGIVSIGY